MRNGPGVADRGDFLLLTAALWLWGCSSAWFWQVAAAQDAVLPHIPYVLWFLPGSLWRLNPVLLPGLLLVITGVLGWGQGRRFRIRPFRPFSVALLFITVLTGAIWGRAVLVETSALEVNLT